MIEVTAIFVSALFLWFFLLYVGAHAFRLAWFLVEKWDKWKKK